MHGIWRNAGRQLRQEGKEQFGAPQGFFPQGPGKVGKQLYQDVRGNQQQLEKGPEQLMGVGESLEGGSHFEKRHLKNPPSPMKLHQSSCYPDAQLA